MKRAEGYTLGKYRILAEIARGGMATVYKAYDTKLERVVALKIPLPQYARDRVFAERFLREARTAAKLDHPNIITVFDVGEHEGTPYFAMQYVDQTLQELLERRGPLPLAEAIPLINQIAAALDHAHERGFVHRDIKPSNVLVTQKGRAILTDFGIAKAADSIRLTRTGELMGSPTYMCPEQIQGLDVDHLGDIYSFGALCYEMLAGKPPFRGQAATVLHAHVYEAPKPLQAENPKVPPAAARVVHKALAKQKKDRHQSAGEMARALDLALTGVRPPQPPGGSPLSRLPKPMLAAAIGLVALVALGLLFTRPQASPSPGLTATWTPVPQPAAEVSTKMPAPSPTRTAVSTTPTPTQTAVPPTPTPTQTAVPHTPTTAPTPACASSVDSQLAGAWDRSGLGCPLGQVLTIWAAWQPFERGYMFWRSDTRRVTVFYGNGTWTEFSEQWTEGAAIPSRGNPPTGLLAPARGFGYIWGVYDSVADGIGWALEEEKGFCARIQSLERGLIFRSSTVKFCQGQLYNWATHPSFRQLFFAVYSDGTWEQR